MATRVNTKFVFILASVIVVIVGGLAAVWFIQIKRSAEEKVRLGDIALASGDVRGAMEQYGRAIAKKRDSVELIDKYEAVLLKVPCKDFVEAKMLLGQLQGLRQSAAELLPNDTERQEAYYGLFIELAEKFGGSVFYEQLHKVTGDKLQQYPDNAVAKRYRGIAAVYLLNPEMPLQRFDEAEADLMATYERDPNDAQVAHHLALYFLRQADRLKRVSAAPQSVADLRNKAVEVSKRSLDVAPDNLDRRLNHLRVLLSPDVNRLDDARAIADQLEQALLKDPQPERAVLAVVEAMPRLHGERAPRPGRPDTQAGLVRAQKVLEAAVEKSPDGVMYRVMLGRVLAIQDERAAAIEQFKAARELSGNKTVIEAVRGNNLRMAAAEQQMNLEIADADAVTDPKAREERLAAIEKQVVEIEAFAGEGSGATSLLRGKLALARRQFRPAMQKLDMAAQQMQGSQQELEAVLLSSRACRLAGERGAALERLKKALQLNPGLVAVRNEAAELHIELQQFDDAQREIDQVLAANPQDPQALSLQARLLGVQGKAGESLAMFERLDPAQRPEIVGPMVQLLVQENRKDEARQLLAQRIEQAPTDVRAVAMLVELTDDAAQKQALIDKARQAGANATMLELLEKRAQPGAEGQPVDQRQLVEDLIARQQDPLQRLLAQAQLYRQTGEADKARTAIAEAAKLAPDNGQVIEQQFNDAIAAKDWAGAEALAVKAGALNLDLAQGAFFRARLASAREQLEEAIAEYRKGLSGVGVFSDGWRQLGEVQMRANDIAGAGESFKKAVEQRPDNVRAVRGLAAVANAQGRHAEALTLLRDAVRYAQNDPDLLGTYLSYEQQHGDPKRALQIRQQLAEAAPQNTDNRRALAMLIAGQDDHAKGIEAMEKLVADEGLTRANVSALASIHGMAGDAAKGRATIQDYLGARGDQAEVEDLMLLARFDLASGNFDQALDSYAAARAKEDPKTRPVTRELADLLFAGGRNDQAVALYRELYDANMDDKVVALRYAEALLRAQKLDEAKAITDRHPDSSQAQVLTAVLALQKNDKAAAKTALEKALQLDSANILARVQLAGLLAEDPQTIARAKDLLIQGLRDNPNATEARIALAQLYQAQGQAPEAIREFRTELDRNPGNAKVRLALVDLYMGQGDPGAAIALLEEAQKRQPEDATWPRLLARALSQRGDIKAAIPHAQRQLELAPQPDGVLQLAALQVRADDARAALDTLAKHPDMLNAEPALQGVRGWALAKTGQDEQAGQVFARAMERAANLPQASAVAGYMVQAYGPSDAISRIATLPAGPNAVWVQLALADLEVQNRQFPAAIVRLDGLQATVESQETAVRSLYHRLLGLALYQGQQLDRAHTVYAKLLELEPNDVATLNNLAYLLVEDLNQPSEGLPLAERAARLAPNSAQVLDTLGWAQFKAGQVDEARRTFEKSLELERLGPAALHLGQVHLKLGSVVRARGYFQQALDLATKANDTVTAEQAKKLLDGLNQQPQQ